VEAIVFHCTSLALPATSTIRRQITRPVELRQADFLEKFDGTTLFYDFVVASALRDRSWVLIGPPLENLHPLLAQSSINGQKLPQLVTAYFVRYLCCDIWMMNIGGGDGVVLDTPFGSHRLEPQDSETHLYKGKRVLYTLSKDNDIRWIFDWVRFHARNHGVDAVLIYDNASTRYSGEDLENALRREFPSFEVNVVHWPFKYGPQGFDDRWWDSNFCQSGAFHDARFRFLDRAASVLNCDIDELVVSETGESVFAATEKASNGYMLFRGKWMASTKPAEVGAPPRHADFPYLDRSAPECPTKWCVAPAKCPLDSQWHTHGVGTTPVYLAPGFSYRHFRSISTDWKYERSPLTPYDPQLHELDPVLAAAMRRAGL
jgi:hypothetical protein